MQMHVIGMKGMNDNAMHGIDVAPVQLIGTFAQSHDTCELTHS